MRPQDPKGEFDKAVRALEATRAKLLTATSPNEVSQIEREVRNNLMAVLHYANCLSFWMKDAADQRRKEIREGLVSVPATPETPEEEKALEANIEKVKKQTKKKRSKKNVSKKKGA